MDTIKSLVGTDAAQWLEAEFAKPGPDILSPVVAQFEAGDNVFRDVFVGPLWDEMLAGDDSLRQRMVFALSQIFVVSTRGLTNSNNIHMTHYVDLLQDNAFGNYRGLLEDVTLSVAMASYLTYNCNEKANPETGSMPDENYAREIMQLFSIGLLELNPDGTERLDASGNTIETYGNEDIEGMARVFTGWGAEGTKCRFSKRTARAQYVPLQHYPDLHSPEEKVFLSANIPAGTSGPETLRIALDTLADHDNTAPFIARQLIQRFTSSHPRPRYVRRVADAFAAGRYVSVNGTSFGTGQRGDLQATMAAILLDETVHQPTDVRESSRGKIREPILKFAHWARAFELEGVFSNRVDRLKIKAATSGIGQAPFAPTSVFNFYRPGYVAPGSESGPAGLTGPELQLITGSTSLNFLNYITDFVFVRGVSKDRLTGFIPDYSEAVALADDPEQLVAYLDLLLTAEQMIDMEREEIVAAVSSVDIASGSAEEDRLRRVQMAVLMIMNSPSFAVIR